MLWRFLPSRGERRPADARDAWAAVVVWKVKTLLLVMLGLVWLLEKRRLVLKAKTLVALAVVVAWRAKTG